MPFDIWLFSTTGEGELPLRWDGATKAVQGIELLVNMFTMIFLTEVGSSLTQPTIGTTLGGSVGGNIYYKHTIFEGVVLSAVQETVDILKSDQDDSTPADETLTAVEVLDISIIGDTLSVYVAIESAAGTSREVKIPTGTVI